MEPIWSNYKALRQDTFPEPNSSPLWDQDPSSESDFSALWEQDPSLEADSYAQWDQEPALDWLETVDSHVFKADLPGLKKEEVKVVVEDGHTLQISGEHRNEDVIKYTDTWHCVERNQCKSLRRLRLPHNANVDEVTAEVDNGVVTVTIPKTRRQEQQQHQAQTRSIDVKSSGVSLGKSSGWNSYILFSLFLMCLNVVLLMNHFII